MPETNPLERELRRRFTLRAESFTHAELSLEILLPETAEELIDVSDFNVDERLPYWAELWPSARALARHLVEALPEMDGPVLELGCGVALPSLVLHAAGRAVLATDYYDEALGFARLNALRNELPPLPVQLVDWRDPPPSLGRFPLALAADVLYEMRNVDALAALLPRVLAPGGSLLLADPGRVYRSSLDERLRAAGWEVQEEARREEPSGTPGGGTMSRVAIVRYRAPGTQNR